MMFLLQYCSQAVSNCKYLESDPLYFLCPHLNPQCGRGSQMHKLIGTSTLTTNTTLYLPHILSQRKSSHFLSSSFK